MKKTIVLVTALVASSGAFADPIGYPGSSWGVLTGPSSVVSNSPEDGNWLFQGKATQGIDWFKFGADKKWTFDTYASFGMSVDKNRIDYNDKFVPALGVKAARSFNHGVLDAGVEAVHEHHFGTLYKMDKQNDSGFQAYVSYWFGWNLKK